MALVPGFPVHLGNNVAVDTGKVLAGLVARNSNGVPRVGIFPRYTTDPDGTELVTGRSDLKVNVGPFEGITSRNGQGVVFIANDSTAVVALNPPPTSNKRKDVLWVRQNDEFTPNTDANSDPVFGMTAGVAGATPAKPSIPDGCTELAVLVISANATSTDAGLIDIQDTYLFTSTAGGVVQVRDATELAAWTPTYGSLAFEQDNHRLYMRRATSWVLIGGATPRDETYRPSTDTIVPGTFKSFGFLASIDDAPAGIYHAGGYMIMNCAAVTDGNIRFTVKSGTNAELIINSDQSLHLAPGSDVHVPVDADFYHPGGDLILQGYDQRAGTGAQIKADSKFTLEFIGASE